MRRQMETCAQVLVLLATFVIVDVGGVVVANGATSNNDGGHQIGSSDLVKQRRALVIIPTPSNSQNIIVKRIGETLNLTCLIKYNTNATADGENRSSSSSAEHSSDAKLSWYLPLDVQNSLHRTNFQERSRGALTVIVTNLKEADSGTYGCEARDFDHLGNFDLMLTARVEVTVKPKKNSCGEQSSFACSTGECIPKRFVCDGRNDCKEGSDESSSTCGSHNPCDGKLRCGDGRCISPQWCCDRTDPNCTTNVSPACCKQLPIPFMDVSQYPQSQQFSDMGFLQTTIYTVIGCAMAFMFIITIMVIAICRVHLKRTNLPRYPHHMNQTSQRQDSWGNIFLHSSGSGLPYTSAASGLLVTYNINNGVQFVGRPVNPPPYSEIVRAPPREGPPPPYASHENIATTTSGSSTPTTTVSSSALATTTANGSSSGLSSTTTAISTNPQPLESQRVIEAPTAATTALSQNRRPAYSENDDEPAAEPLLSENNNGDINGNSTSEVTVEPDSNVIPATVVVLGNSPATGDHSGTSDEQQQDGEGSQNDVQIEPSRSSRTTTTT